MEGAESPETGKKSKKRKREPSSQDDNGKESKRRSIGAQSILPNAPDSPKERQELYQALCKVLDVLVRDASDHESASAVLRMDLISAAQFLGSWIDASTNVVSLSAALEIWKHRVVTPCDDVLLVFSKYCLAPAAAMMVHLNQ